MAAHSDTSEHPVITKSGEVRWGRERGRAVKDETGHRMIRAYGGRIRVASVRRGVGPKTDNYVLRQLGA